MDIPHYSILEVTASPIRSIDPPSCIEIWLLVNICGFIFTHKPGQIRDIIVSDQGEPPLKVETIHVSCQTFTAQSHPRGVCG